MLHLLVAGKLHPSGEAMLETLGEKGVRVEYVEEVSEASYAPLIARADALVIRTQPLSAATIAQAENLRVVSRHGVGYDSVDLNALNARGIALTIVGDVNSVSVAEHAMTQILCGAKQVLRADQAVRDPSQWGWRNRLEQREISGKTLLIMGYGRIGRRLAKMALAFDMKVCAYDPYLLSSGWPDGPVRPVERLEDGLAEADFISVHIPKSDRPLLGDAEFSMMKPGVVIANTARGGVVCEAALHKALCSGHVAAAGLDVFDVEPPKDGTVFRACDTALLSPHIAGLTNECGERMALASLQNALDFLSGDIDPALIVNPEVLHAV
ncbi:hydroxyacid dehydrogenase [Celeribacter sp.]|uniref:hydroxyacid dehydrogenase n=1 Tax=Celeribacter sp. TaxID=1890673 RepID=UPI003A9311CE